MSTRFRSLIIALAVLLVGGPAGAEERLAVIVHPSRSAALSTADLAQIYMKQRRYWPNRRPIIPVNREVESNERATFADAVFGDQAAHLGLYWNRKYFVGLLPPATLASAEAVKRFVATEPNAIGYVEASSVDDSVRVVLYLE